MKKLKQDALFVTLKKRGVSIQLYLALYSCYHNKLSEQYKDKLPAQLYDKGTGKLTEKAIGILNEVDKLFKGADKKVTLKSMFPDYLERIQEYNELFPEGKLPSGKKARCTIPELEKKFLWFFTNFNFDWATIYKATQRYISEKEQDNYATMRTSMYFIQKTVDGELHCDLGQYCEDVLENPNDVEVIQTKFKTNIIE